MRHDTLTAPFKAIYAAMVSVLTLAMVVGAFYMQGDPRFTETALASLGKRMFYVASFAAENAFGAANVFTGIGGDNAPGGPADSVPVLVYHGIIDEPDGSTINLTEAEFKEQLFALKRAGYETITLDELYAFGRGEGVLPAKPVLITFDDGRADSYYNGDPILDAVGYSAVMFPITKYVKGSEAGGYYLSPDELKIMARSGRWEIGSHSDQGHEQYQISDSGEMGNFYSNFLWKADDGRAETTAEFTERIARDFADSRRYLEDLLGTPIASFAFPFGDLGQNQKDAREKTADIIASASSVYRLLFYQYRPGEYFTQFTKRQGGSETLLVHRIEPGNEMSGASLVELLADGASKPLPYIDTLDENNGWVDIWGSQTFENGVLRMTAEPLKTGASTILDGSANWKDYIVRADVTSPQRTGVLVWVRFKDDNNNAGCNFGTGFVHVEQVLDGEHHVLKGVDWPQGVPEGPFTAEVRVEGRTIVCSLNGKEIVRTEFLDPALERGGIGMKIWDEALGKSAVNIEQIAVEEIKGAE